MSQNNTLSAKAQSIIDNFIKNNKWYATRHNKKTAISLTDPMMHVIVTLYAQKPDAKPELVGPFRDCIFDLRDYFTQEEVDILVSECGQVILYCYEHAEEMRNSYLYDESNDYTEEILSNDNPLNIYKTPKCYIDLCMRLSNKWNTKGKVYLPYADVADYPLYNPDAEYYIECQDESLGHECVENYTNAYFQILLDSLGIQSKTVYGDSTFYDYKNNFEANPDYIFVCLPHVQSDNVWHARNPQDVTAYELGENLLIWTSLLNPNGAIDFICPQDYLENIDFWRGFQFSFDPKKLGNRQVTIIKLKGFFAVDNFSPVLIHIEKNNEIGRYIRFIDATGNEFYNYVKIEDIGSYCAGLNVDVMMKVVNSKEANSKYESRFLFGQLADSKDDCVFHQYLIDKKLPTLPDGENYVSISELIEIVPSEKVEEGKFPVLATNMLSSKYTDCNIALDHIKTKRIDNEPEMGSDCRPTYFSMKEECVVAGWDDNSLKFGKIATDPERPIALMKGITPFHIKKGIVTEDYLLRELGKEYCTTQARMLCINGRHGMPDAYIPVQNFLEIKIAVPSLEEQERRCKEDARKSLELARKHLNEADRQLLQSAEEFKRDVHMKKHAIGQTLFNMKNWWDLLQKARTEGNGLVDDDKEIGKFHKTKVADVYANIQMAMEKLQMQVDSFWRAYSLQTEDMSLDVFVKTYIKEHPSPLFIYEYNQAASTNNKVLNVTFSKQALAMVFDNIINNACSHGFEDKASDRNIVKVEVLTDGVLPYITISNNGKPIHGKITAEDVFTYGRSSNSGQKHFGIGGYEVRYLMRTYGGDAEIISTPQENFPVSYKLTFKESNKNVKL